MRALLRGLEETDLWVAFWNRRPDPRREIFSFRSNQEPAARLCPAVDTSGDGGSLAAAATPAPRMSPILSLKTVATNAGWLGLAQALNYALPLTTVPVV